MYVLAPSLSFGNAGCLLWAGEWRMHGGGYLNIFLPKEATHNTPSLCAEERGGIVMDKKSKSKKKKKCDAEKNDS